MIAWLTRGNKTERMVFLGGEGSEPVGLFFYDGWIDGRTSMPRLERPALRLSLELYV